MAKMKPNDPAYWMLERGRKEKVAESNRTRFLDPFSLEQDEEPEEKWCTTPTVHSDNCYICRDPEYSLMGLPLCFACFKCGGHVAADDSVCDDCGVDQREKTKWEWLAHKRKSGLAYGMFKWNGRMYNAHRIAWMLQTGQYPTGKTICHTCDNPGCVNPNHLFEGTQLDNIQDMVEKGRNKGPTSENSHFAKLNRKQVRIIREMYATGDYTQKQLAKLFPVEKSMIGYIVNGDCWK